ncbi:predicted protein [Nematostella vectensis]|uniref:LicD/FKTN/FKRP nucleotidyltransferase domain-containing protein n=1 Tax=Nematostella vectensis TaxID=45351 RepID=A7S582_NEMVE|nr:predicted protein [Nematostella vectensis]|eukprot:XP_001633221.1 predicted protein [Nematostella vectensis]
MELPHWLMYGSIYGAMRYDAPLPWDNDVDMGMRREDFDSIDFMEFSAKFKAAGIEFRNGLAQAGKFHFTKIGGKLEVDLFLFRDYGGVLWRTGIEPWLLYVHYRRHHTFPTWLVKLPLPKTKFGSFEIGLPRGEFEILKHLYPDDWWKVVKPQACHDT